MHRYIETLAKGQSQIGEKVTVLDRIGAEGDYQVALGDDAVGECLNESDVVHLHFAWSARPFLQRHGRHLASTRQVFHFHGPWSAEALAQGQGYLNALGKWLYEQSVYRRQRRFICASTVFASRLGRLYGIEKKRIGVVAPGVDIDRFRPGQKSSARQVLGLPEDRYVFAGIRRLEPRMGLHVAIDAIARLPDAVLVIAGTGSLQGALQGHIDELALGERVRLLGRIPDDVLPLLYQAADTTLVPSVTLEGFGMVVLESLACGTGVIASNVGGLPEALGPFAEAWTYDAGDPAQLLHRMREAMSSPLPPLEARAFAETRRPDIVAREIDDVVRP
jgi:glycosyltransferase involved in cell wall biosynthesis